MTTYTDVFGGSTIYPSEISYSAVALVADITLDWPEETSSFTNLATRIVDVAAVIASLSITLPNASLAGTGQTLLFNNKGSEAFFVKDASGTQILAVLPGTAWQVYLVSNTTTAGAWETVQFGASVSQANAASLAGTGLVAQGTLLSQAVPVTEFNSDYVAGNTDRARFFVWTGSNGVITLPSPLIVGNNWFALIRNEGSGSLTVESTLGIMVDGAASISLQPGEAATFVSDGVNYHSVGRGQSATFAFDYTSIGVAGSGNYTLSGSELNRIAYNFTGALTGNRTVIIPATVQQYWISNSTTGSFLFTVKTAAGTGQTLASGQRAIYYCDGVNLVDADTSTASFPISIAQGGTGGVSASSARINLGSSSIGDAIFTAIDANAVWSALGNAPVVSGGYF